MNKLSKYRPEIDGLGAIAVILVIIFHAHYLTDEGFFLEGAIFLVDMFYVVSGYLMTTIILNQINDGGPCWLRSNYPCNVNAVLYY